MKLTHLLATSTVLTLFLVPSASGGRRNSPQLAETVDLPATFNLDFALASKMRSEMGSVRDAPVNGDPGRVGQEVFSDLTNKEMVTSLGLPYRWTFSVLRSSIVNAISLPDGEVAAYRGLTQLIGTNRGLWAAVLSHEIAHVERRHAVRKALYHLYLQQQIEYYKMREALGDKSAGWAVLALRVSGAIAEKKLSRDLEHDADSQGMLLMARAGYHPDNVFAIHHLLRLATGEQSKFGAFLSDHPRWETRDQRSDRAYIDAVAEYNRLWPNPGLSPGRPAPVVAFLGKSRTIEDQQGSSSDIVMSLSCRNATEPITLVVRLSDKEDRSLATPDNAETRRRVFCADRDDAQTTTIHVPSTVAAGHERVVKARLDFLTPDGSVLERSKEIDVHLPKIGKGTSTLAKVEIESALADDGVLAQERQPESSPVQPKIPIRSVLTTAANPQTDPAQTHPMSFGSAAPKQVSAGSIPGLGMTVETDLDGGARVVNTTSAGFAESIGFRVGYVITAVNNQPVRTASDLATCQRTIPFE